jgi:hypothetical protein
MSNGLIKVILISVFFPFAVVGQDVFPYMDNVGYMRSFENGFSRQVEFLPPVDVKYSEKIIAYIDNKNDLFIYDGRQKEMLSNMASSYQIGYHIAAWNTGPILNVWDNGKKRTLTRFGRNYVVSDSLVVFEDLMENAIRVYYQDSIYELYRTVGPPIFPAAVGSNTVAFEGNGNVHYAFVAGRILEIGVINDVVKYSTGGNKVAFNDPFNQSFAVVQAKEIVDVESIQIRDYKAGNDIVVYRDLNNQLLCYMNNEVIELSNYSARSYEVFRNTVVWNEAGLFFAFDGKQKYELANYIPEEYKIRDGIVAFRNLNGGVSMFANGEVKVISNLPNAPFEVNGTTVRVQVNRGNFIFFKDGKSFDM